MVRENLGLRGKHRRTRRRATKARGFTLLEVMIALTVFATLAAAVISAGQYSVRQNARLKAQIQCAWLADNQLTELRSQAVTPGYQQLLWRFDQREWEVEQTITPQVDPRMLKVDISVQHPGSDQPVCSARGWVSAAHD